MAETLETLIYCFNAVEDELARYYFPLVTEENFSSETGEYKFVNFKFQPVKIKSVKSGKKSVNYSILPHQLHTNATSITVEYEYSPAQKQLYDLSEFDGVQVSESLIVAGILAEYCLTNGEVQAAELWESKYRQKIDIAQSRRLSSISIPPRRWV